MKGPNIGRLVNRGSAAYQAAEYIFKNGPQLPDRLFAAIDFGPNMSSKQEKLDRAVNSGWLIQGADCQVKCGEVARAHFKAEAGIEEEVKPLGQIAALREPVNVFARPPLSKKYIPNPRGMRQDVPEWSVRAGASFKSLAGGDA